ncbi:hypothetical protein [Bizionia psychrotolerans]|uniref:hypothetical protein n=1 Tax=Bizionia psychrotolerans TaxID=1492901 RepID=UPI0006508FDC|nr:hypothetical protein [Bizionia psychrotolerans]
MACNNKLTNSILFNCADMPIKGLAGGKAVLINYDDINRSASTASGATISDLVTTADGLSLTWYKELASSSSTFAPNAEDIDGFTHSFLGRIPTTTAEAAERANELKGGLFIVVVETKYKGIDYDDAFKVYGWQNGLRLSELTQSSNENSGSMLFTLATAEGTVEQYPYHIFLEMDYGASKATFDTLFSSGG